MRRWIGEKGNEVEHLEEGSGPAVGEDEREGSGSFALGVEEVDVAVSGVELIVVEDVEAIDLCFPVEEVGPVRAEIGEEVEVESLGAVRMGDIVGPARSLQTRVQIVHGDG